MTFKNSGGTPTKIVEYAYDHGQRWVRKTLDTNADGTIEQSQVFVHDNGQIVLDFQKTGTSAAGNSDLAHRYLWGNAVDQLLADETVDDGSEEDVAWALTDHLNSVRDLVVYDPITGTVSVVKHLTFDAFGNVTSDSTPTVLTLFRYTARPFDADTDLQNNLNRWYDATTGRWLSTDPVGFEAGDVNLYRYVANRPVSLIDPSGLQQALPPDLRLVPIDPGPEPPDLRLVPIDPEPEPPTLFPPSLPGEPGPPVYVPGGPTQPGEPGLPSPPTLVPGGPPVPSGPSKPVPTLGPTPNPTGELVFFSDIPGPFGGLNVHVAYDSDECAVEWMDQHYVGFTGIGAGVVSFVMYSNAEATVTAAASKRKWEYPDPDDSCKHCEANTCVITATVSWYVHGVIIDTGPWRVDQFAETVKRTDDCGQPGKAEGWE